MKSHQKSILRPQRTILRSKKPSLKSINGGGEYLELILIDLIIEIISRLPAKSIPRFRCLSKLWMSILRRPYFTELFFTKSSSRPQVLFAFPKDNDVFFFSIPQPRNHDEKLSPVVATYVMKTPFRVSFERFNSFEIYSNINGLVFFREEWNTHAFINDTELLALICNPSTRQSLAIPNLTFRRKCFLGYDPIENKYKLLSMTLTSYKVLTLGSGNLLWRDIICSTKNYTVYDGICIDGVLYYLAAVNNTIEFTVIVSFDITSEKVHFMKSIENFSKAMHCGAILINYNGKLGSFKSDDTPFADGRSKRFEIWVLEDPKRHEWSHHIHVLPPLWKNVAGKTYLSIVGVLGTDEIVLSQSNYENEIFYVF